jgi:TonB family protein
MDASNRSFHVYGKTESGKKALKLARGALPSAARQLLILLDGQRTLGDLFSILGAEAVEGSLEELEARGYVELVRHFPEGDENPQVAAPPPSEGRAERTHAAPRRRSALVLLAVLVAIIGVAWPFLRSAIESTSRTVVAWSVASPPPAAAGGMTTAPTVKAPERPPLPVGSAHPGAPVPTNDRPLTESKPEPRPGPERQDAKPQPEVVASPVPSEPSPATASPAIALHVRSQVTPQIPQKARDLGIKSGHVVVILDVAPKGTVERVELVSASPPQMYDQEMQQTFEKWTFDPPGVHGRMTVQVDVAPQ